MGTPYVISPQFALQFSYSFTPLQSKMFTRSRKRGPKMSSNLRLNVSEAVSYAGVPGYVEHCLTQ